MISGALIPASTDRVLIFIFGTSLLFLFSSLYPTGSQASPQGNAPDAISHFRSQNTAIAQSVKTQILRFLTFSHGFKLGNSWRMKSPRTWL
jgi:hypothetical protein